VSTDLYFFVPQLQLLLHDKQSLSNIISAKETQWSGNMLTHQVMCFWIKGRDKLVHDYSLVGYILSPNLTIMVSAIVNKSQMHNEAAERLITKLILDQSIVGNKWRIARARANLIDTFLTEYGDFTNKRNSFARNHIWIIAQDPNLKAFCWHQKYSLPITKVLGWIACLVLSKILGIGMAEQNWKQVKAVKLGQRVTTTMDKTMKQV
jgi:hypothetical protein